MYSIAIRIAQRVRRFDCLLGDGSKWDFFMLTFIILSYFFRLSSRTSFIRSCFCMLSSCTLEFLCRTAFQATRPRKAQPIRMNLAFSWAAILNQGIRAHQSNEAVWSSSFIYVPFTLKSQLIERQKIF